MLLLLLLLPPLAVTVPIMLVVSGAHVSAADAVSDKRLLVSARDVQVPKCKLNGGIHAGAKV